jgi:hypothetical protein
MKNADPNPQPRLIISFFGDIFILLGVTGQGEEILHPGSLEVLVPEEPLCILEEKMEPEEQN